jgi:hypothetical protein
MNHIYSYFSRSLHLALVVAVLGVVCLAQDSPLRILEQSKPDLPENFGTLDAQGTIMLRLEFLATGRLGVITPIKGLTRELTDLAVASARKIRFEPEVRGGKNIDLSRVVLYLYSWEFGGWKVPGLSGPSGKEIITQDGQAEAVIQKAIQNLGGEKYLNVKSQIGRGKYSILRGGMVLSFQTFVDVIVYPDKERTDFKASGVKTVQTNVGDTGWVYDGNQELVKVQDEKQIENFKRGMRTSLDYLLRGYWRGEAELAYVGKRPATLGKRNEVIKLTYKDGLVVEYEFSAEDGLPQKGSYTRLNADNEEIKEEDRYAQFVDVGRIKTPFIIDRFTGGVHSSRINYQTVEYNKTIPDSIFEKPANAKDAKKDLKL